MHHCSNVSGAQMNGLVHTIANILNMSALYFGHGVNNSFMLVLENFSLGKGVIRFF
jgi:hypothetical protein